MQQRHVLPLVTALFAALSACSSPNSPGVSGADAGNDPSQTADGGTSGGVGASSGAMGGSSGAMGGSSGAMGGSSGAMGGSSGAMGGSSGSTVTSTGGSSGSNVSTGGSSGMAGGSSSGGGSSSVPGTPCMGSRDCDLGNLCVGGFCTPGCQTENDCPNGDVCDVNAGPNGACVECLTANDCGGQAPVCDNGVCRQSCNASGQCPFPTTCNTATNVCVRCLDDNGCFNGAICVNNDCVDGCRMDADCGPGDLCDPATNQCVQGCHANPNTCRPGFRCDETAGAFGQCVSGCNVAADCGDPQQFTCTGGQCIRACQQDGDCPNGAICESGSCTRGCRPPDRGCPNGSYCDSTASGVAGQCIPGCDTSQDCFGGLADTCDVATHTCVECLQQSDCQLPGPGSNVMATCNANHQCEIQCDPNAMFSVCDVLGFTCDANTNICVGCAQDADCETFETCVDSRCLGQPNRPLCAACDVDDDCGGPADLCVTRQLPVGQERVCGVDCSAGQTCPAGTTCQTVGGGNGLPPRGQQCLPVNSVHRFTTCAARNDVVDQTMCDNGGQCGRAGGLGGNGDAICSGFGGSMGMCSMFCAVGGNDCPEGFFCEDPAGDPAPRCAPN